MAFRKMIFALTLVALTLGASAQVGAGCATQRCGLTWDDANGKCGRACPGNTSEECSKYAPGEDCFSNLSRSCTTCVGGTPPPASSCATQRCGLTWDDANGKCGRACPNNTSEECSKFAPGEDCFSNLSRSCTTCAGGTPPPTPAPTPTPTPTPTPPGSVPGVQFFPPGILTQLTTLTGFNSLQLTNILGMIQGPEQSRTEWWLTATGAPIWSYAEDIGDGRGVTIGLYGATTGVGYSDADVIWANYGTTLAAVLASAPGATNVQKIINYVKSVANDPNWQAAMFNAYITTYWQPTMNMLRPLGYTRALTFGAVLDASMNAGLGDDTATNWGSEHLVRVAKTGTASEAAFLKKFNAQRILHPTLNSGNMKLRVGAWQKLQTAGKWTMSFPFSELRSVPRAYIP